MSLTSSWLNSILKVSSLIHRQKEKLMTSGIFATLVFSIVIILLEIILFVVSLPSYFFIGHKEIRQMPKNEATCYTLRRKVSLAALFGVALVILMWIVVIFFLTFIIGSNKVHSAI